MIKTRVQTFLMATGLIGGVLLSAGPPAEPWSLDLATRLSIRTQIEERAAVGRGNRVVTEQGMAGTSSRIVVSGKETPEAVLPWELYRFLLSTAFSDDAATATKWRERFAARDKTALVSPAFWREFELVTLPVLRIESESRALVAAVENGSTDKANASAKMRELQAAHCAARAEALSDTLARYGKARFLQFLYVAVAPDLTIETDKAIPADRHRFIERGCK